MSSHLYVICMERLAQLIDYEVRVGNWIPWQASRDGQKVSNLAFFDDLILFCGATANQDQVMKEFLERFSKASRRKVRLDKSRIYFSENTNIGIRDSICAEIGFEATY